MNLALHIYVSISKLILIDGTSPNSILEHDVLKILKRQRVVQFIQTKPTLPRKLLPHLFFATSDNALYLSALHRKTKVQRVIGPVVPKLPIEPNIK